MALPAFDHTKMRERYLRQVVRFPGKQRPGTIVVDTTGPFLYFVEPGGWATRYGIAVGKEGFEWDGDAQVKWKQKWPTWTPPAEMIERKPQLAEFADGMPAGVENPLGARAMYLFKDGKGHHVSHSWYQPAVFNRQKSIKRLFPDDQSGRDPSL